MIIIDQRLLIYLLLCAAALYVAPRSLANFRLLFFPLALSFPLFFVTLLCSFSFMQLHWYRLSQKSQLSPTPHRHSLRREEKRVSQLEASAALPIPHSPSLLKRLNHTIISSGIALTIIRPREMLVPSSWYGIYFAAAPAFRNTASSSNGHPRLIRERVSCRIPWYVREL